MTEPFKREQCRMYGGFTWYCQKPGALWKTDPELGWELEYHRGDGPTGWYLYGGDPGKDEYMDFKFNEAIREAARYIKERKK